jgi:hypothetical protein
MDQIIVGCLEYPGDPRDRPPLHTYSTTVGDGPKVHFLRLGSVRQRDQFAPNLQLWSRSAQRWIKDVGSIPQIEKQPAFTPSGAVSDEALMSAFGGKVDILSARLGCPLLIQSGHERLSDCRCAN